MKKPIISKKSAEVIIIDKEQKEINKQYLMTNKLGPAALGMRQYSLDLFGNREGFTPLPNDLCRAGLFSIEQTVEREFCDGMEIFTTDPTVKIIYTGKDLQSATDERVWAQLINLAKDKPLGEIVTTNISTIIKGMGKPTNGHYYKAVWASLERLYYAHLKAIKGTKRKTVAWIRLINLHMAEGTDTDSDGEIQFSLDNRFDGWLLLVANNTTTLLDNEAVRSLKPMAFALYKYAMSHKEPLPISIQNFHKICRSKAKLESKQDLANWRSYVRKAIKQILDNNLLKNCIIENDYIFFVRQ